MYQIYSAGVSVFLGGNKPSRTGDVRGDMSINFSCDPEISSKLVGIVLSSCLFYLSLVVVTKWPVISQIWLWNRWILLWMK